MCIRDSYEVNLVDQYTNPDESELSLEDAITATAVLQDEIVLGVRNTYGTAKNITAQTIRAAREMSGANPRLSAGLIGMVRTNLNRAGTLTGPTLSGTTHGYVNSTGPVPGASGATAVRALDMSEFFDTLRKGPYDARSASPDVIMAGSTLRQRINTWLIKDDASPIIPPRSIVNQGEAGQVTGIGAIQEFVDDFGSWTLATSSRLGNGTTAAFPGVVVAATVENCEMVAFAGVDGILHENPVDGYGNEKIEINSDIGLRLRDNATGGAMRDLNSSAALVS